MCESCGWELESFEMMERGFGGMLCSVCVGRLGDHLDPVHDDMADLMPI